MAKPVRLRERAHDDLDRAVAYYATEGGADLAERFIDAVQAARDHLAMFPLTGSLRFAHETGIEELRSWSLRRFPYLVLCLDRDTYVDVLRVLHTRRDVPATLAPRDSE